MRPVSALAASGLLGLLLGATVLGARLFDPGIPLTLLRPAVGALLLVAALVLASRLTEDHRAALAGGAMRLAPALPLLAACTALGIGVLAFRDFPSSADEWGYVFGAETLAAGRLTALPTPDPGLFRQVYVIEAAGFRVSQYLPGWPAMLVPAVLAGAPLVLVSAAALGLMLFLLRCAVGADAVGGATLLAAACSAMVLLNGATLFNHVATTAATLAAILALRRNDPLGDALAGAAWSAVALQRLDVAIPLALVLAAAGLFGLRWRRAAAMLAGAAPGVGLLLAYNAAITGNPLTPPTVWGGNLAIGAGGIAAVEAEFAEAGALRRIVAQTVWRLVELSDTWPLLPVLAWLALLPRRTLAGRLRAADALLPATLALFALFPDFGGFQIGPRYWFTALIVALIAVAEEVRHAGRRSLVVTALLVGAPAQLALAATITVHLAGLFAERRAVFDLAGQLTAPALIMIGSHGSAWDRRFNRSNRHAAQDLMRNPPLLDRPVWFVRDLPEPACAVAGAVPVLRFIPAVSGGPALAPVACR